ncbi:MAG: hypothetical protein H8D97_01315 [Proteobacteria bacterium]|nr:hypothetical protein [Pseudomonadota bacterium]
MKNTKRLIFQFKCRNCKQISTLNHVVNIKKKGLNFYNPKSLVFKFGSITHKNCKKNVNIVGIMDLIKITKELKYNA